MKIVKVSDQLKYYSFKTNAFQVLSHGISRKFFIYVKSVIPAPYNWPTIDTIGNKIGDP